MVLKVLERSTHKRWKCRKYFHHPILGASSFTHVSCLLCLASHHSPWGERDHRAANPKPLIEHMSLQWQLREPRTSQSTYQTYPRAKNWFVWTLLFILHLFSLSHHPSCITPSGHALYFGVNFCRAVFNEVSNTQVSLASTPVSLVDWNSTRVGNPKWVQSEATILFNSHGCNSFYIDTEVCSCQSWLWHWITVTVQRIFE